MPLGRQKNLDKWTNVCTLYIQVKTQLVTYRPTYLRTDSKYIFQSNFSQWKFLFTQQNNKTILKFNDKKEPLYMGIKRMYSTYNATIDVFKSSLSKNPFI